MTPSTHASLRVSVDHIRSQTGGVVLLQYAGLSLSAASVILNARAFGPSGYGVLTVLAAVSASLAPLSSLGAGTTLIYGVRREGVPVSSALSSVSGLMACGMTTSIVAYILFCGLALKLDVPSPVIVIAVGVSELLFVPITLVAAHVYLAAGEPLGYSKALGAISAARASTALLAWQLGLDLSMWGWIASCSLAVVAAAVVASVHRRYGVSFHLRRPVASTTRRSIATALSVAASQTQDGLDRIVLSGSHSLADAGAYGLAYRMMAIGLVPAGSVNYSRFADVMSVPRSELRSQRLRADRRMIQLGALGCLMAAVLATVGGGLAGGDFVDLIPLTIGLSLVPLVRATGIASGNILHVLAPPSHRAGAGLGQLVVAAFLYLTLIPALGTKGALTGTILSELVGAVSLRVLSGYHLNRASLIGDEELS